MLIMWLQLAPGQTAISSPYLRSLFYLAISGQDHGSEIGWKVVQFKRSWARYLPEKLLKTMLRYHDRLYGTVVIKEPVIPALIETAAVQRLRGVLQHGITGLIGITKPTTRFEHSLGTMILVKRMGASLEEQIAALLHDVSHTVFSHVVDYVYHNHNNQSFHDEHKVRYIAKTDLPEVLARFGFDWHDILDETRFTMLEQPAPALCGDRVDYFLRDSLDLGLATKKEVDWMLSHLRVYQDRFVVDDLDVACWLGDTYIEADKASWANFREVGIYELTARVIRWALRQGVLDETDLWGQDRVVWQKLQAADDPDLRIMLATITPDTQFVWDEQMPDFRVSTKIRTIDPDVILADNCAPLSNYDPAFAQRRSKYLNDKTGMWPMKVLSG